MRRISGRCQRGIRHALWALGEATTNDRGFHFAETFDTSNLASMDRGWVWVALQAKWSVCARSGFHNGAIVRFS
jgi:hypothetical protein